MQPGGIEFQILGYDARRTTPGWRAQRADCGWAAFLLRMDLELPASTDDTVWESALDWCDAEVGRPDWVGPYQYLWENLAALEEFLECKRHLALRPYWVIAIARARNAIAESSLVSKMPGVAITYDGVTPDAPQAKWEFLGYDVSDYFQLSGLMNCGYDGEVDGRAALFASRLNAFHLFDDFEDADKCRVWMDERVEEHSPFFVHALFRIREER